MTESPTRELDAPRTEVHDGEVEFKKGNYFLKEVRDETCQEKVQKLFCDKEMCVWRKNNLCNNNG